MSLAILYSRAMLGVQAPLVTVEVHLSNGLPQLSIVGLPETAVKESKDRVRSALLNSQFEFPAARITINLAPAELPKQGGRFDLPIALGILAASGQIPAEPLVRYEFAGELTLSGALLPFQGALPFALATRTQNRQLMLTAASAKEAALATDMNIFPVSHLLEACRHLTGAAPIEPCLSAIPEMELDSKTALDLREVRGQPVAKRALEITAAGGHSLLMLGPPGAGKTMLASRLPSILPNLTLEQGLEIAAIKSISRQDFEPKDFLQRPFRAPHHTASSVALVGGGNPPQPGEISLAHHGVLFLDELPEFSRKVLETLREPMESGRIIISRATRQAEFPAAFQFVAAMNPCPCGYAGYQNDRCRCHPAQVQRYQERLSGPFLDRVDLLLEVLPVNIQALEGQQEAGAPEDSLTIRTRVTACQHLQLKRQNCLNAQLFGEKLTHIVALSASEQAMLRQAMDKLQLSARAYHRILRLARTIADLAESIDIQKTHLIEALSYRQLLFTAPPS